MEIGIFGDRFAGRSAIAFAPGFQQGFRLNETDAAFPELKPLPCQQGLAGIAHIAVARMDLRRQTGDASTVSGIVEQDAQDRRRLRSENRAWRTSLRVGPVRDGTLEVDGVECESRVPHQIEIGDLVVQADDA